MTDTSPITNSASNAQTPSKPAAVTSSVDKLANEQTFLQLFVSQLKNQDPLNPADGTQFVTQLAQFSQLEQTLGMSENVAAIRQQIAPATTDSKGQNAAASGTSGS
jgi:flagellar basal-body rod modification protein FlgD